MKLVGVVTATFVLFFCMFGIQIAIEANMLRRMRRREHFSSTQLKEFQKSAHAVSNSAHHRFESTHKSCNRLVHYSALLPLYKSATVAISRIFSFRTFDFLSVMLAPPLAPPPKA